MKGKKSKIIRQIIFSIAVLLCGCATTHDYPAHEIRLQSAIKYEEKFPMMSKQQVLTMLGDPHLTEVYNPWCNSVEIWHYSSGQCCEGLHMALVNDTVQDVGYW